MTALHAIGPAVFCVVSLVVGLRFLALALRTQEMPEMMFAIAFLSAGTIGYGGLALAAFGVTKIPLLGVSSLFTGLAGIGIGSVGVATFTWRVFRPDSLIALAVLVTGILVIATSILMQVLTGHGDMRDLESPWFWIGYPHRTLAYAWSSVEALRYYGLMRRRLRLGLAEPELANRFLLWGIAAFAAFLTHLPILVDVAAGSPRPAMEPFSATASSALGLVAGVTMWCAFFRRGRRAAPEAPAS